MARKGKYILFLLVFFSPALFPTEVSGIDKVDSYENYYKDNSTDVNECASISIKVGECTTYNETIGLRYKGYCPYDVRFNSRMHINGNDIVINVSSCSMLNSTMCGDLNRHGLLCSKCKAGYGPSLYSRTWKCEKCNDNKQYLMWILYLLLELIPLTIFFIIVIIFNVRATSPPFTAYVFYCQYFTILFQTDNYFRLFVINYINPYVYKLVFTVIDVWSLDFLRLVIPPFCVSSSLTNMQVLFFGLIPALYPFLLIFITYIFIELHARNVYVVIQLWKPFHKCFVKVRRSYDSKASIFNSFSTLLLLSFSKIFFIGSHSFYTTGVIKYPNGTQDNEIHAAYYDPNLPEPVLLPYLIPSMILLALFTLTPTLFLFLHPIKIYRKFLVFICCKDLRCLQSFLDTFQGHYKDGTNGTRDYRAMAGLQLVCRVIILMAHGWHESNEQRIILITYKNSFLIIISMSYFIFQPCKKNYMNTIEGSLYSIAAIVSNLLFYLLDSNHPGNVFNIYLVLFLIFVPSLVVLALFIYSLLIKIPFCKSHITLLNEYLLKLQERNTISDEDEFPHRITASDEYAPLI